jgi:hypothetical protein
VGLRNPRIQKGDLVEHTKPASWCVGKVYLVVRTAPSWIMLLGEEGVWSRAEDYVVTYEGG